MNTLQFLFPDKKREELKRLLSVAVSDGSVSIRQLARIAGSVTSLSRWANLPPFHQSNVLCNRVEFEWVGPNHYYISCVAA